MTGFAVAGLYFVCAVWITKMRCWAANCGLIVTIVQLCFVSDAVIFVVSAGFIDANIVVLLLWAAALIRLIMHLRKATRYIDPQTAHGFEPLIPNNPNSDLPIAALANPPAQNDQSLS